MNPSNPENWKVVCSACGMEWFSNEIIDLIGGHFQKEHPDLEHPHLNTIWVGVGSAPKEKQKPLPKRRRR